MSLLVISYFEEFLSCGQGSSLLLFERAVRALIRRGSEREGSNLPSLSAPPLKVSPPMTSPLGLTQISTMEAIARWPHSGSLRALFSSCRASPPLPWYLIGCVVEGREMHGGRKVHQATSPLQ